LEKNGTGKKHVTYKLRDWLVSRQRYWGCPIPFVHCEKCGIIPVKEEDLPIKLPDDVEFNNSGNPLDKHLNWKYTKCPICGKDALRETDTLDTFFESSWYFLRYIDPNYNNPINQKVVDECMPVDLYIGGIEHAILHLLYARFFTLVLRDMEYLSLTHPFEKLLTQGMVCHKSYKNQKGEWLYPEEIDFNSMTDKQGNKVTEGPVEKMSKSKKNLVNPNQIIETHGIDAVRLFIISDTPPEKDLDWNTDALDGSLRFLNRIWNLFQAVIPIIKENRTGEKGLIKITHVYIKKITLCLEKTMLNKVVAYLRELFNEIEKNIYTASSESLKFAFISFVKAIEPITPFVSHEILETLEEKDNSWPNIDESLATVDVITIAVQVNGKLKSTFETAINTDEKTLETIALEQIGNPNNVKKIIVEIARAHV
jgi:leucyl-tRNA synthetase